MNLVSLYLYGADVLSTADAFFVFMTAVMFISSCVLTVLTLCRDKVDIKVHKWYDLTKKQLVGPYSEIAYRERSDPTKYAFIEVNTEEYVRILPGVGKWTRLTIPLVFLFFLSNMVIPERNTMLLIATSQTAEYVATTPLGVEASELVSDTLKLLKQKITETLGK